MANVLLHYRLEREPAAWYTVIGAPGESFEELDAAIRRFFDDITETRRHTFESEYADITVLPSFTKELQQRTGENHEDHRGDAGTEGIDRGDEG